MKQVILTFLFLLFSAGVLPAQDQFFGGDNELSVLFKDKYGAVITGMRLVFKKADATGTDFTDINGEIHRNLTAGEYEITISNVDPGLFRAFIRLGNGGLPPHGLEFIVDAERIFPADKARPVIAKFVYPTYPPAARAVGAYGEIIVAVKIDKEGRVISDQPISGHPLLRAVSRNAARQFLFEPSENSERTAILGFVFLHEPTKTEKKELKGYENPYRLVIEPGADIQTNSTHDQKK